MWRSLETGGDSAESARKCSQPDRLGLRGENVVAAQGKARVLALLITDQDVGSESLISGRSHVFFLLDILFTLVGQESAVTGGIKNSFDHWPSGFF